MAELSNDEIEAELEQIVTQVENDTRDTEWAWDTYRTKLGKVKEKAGDAVGQEQIQRRAIKMVRSAAHRETRVSREVEEVDILAIGHSGVQRWTDSDNGGKKDVLIAYGVVNPGPAEDGSERPKGIGVFICDETRGADIGNIRSAFDTLNNLTGWFSVAESEELPNTYVLNSTDRTRVEEAESDLSDEDKREFLHSFVDDEAEIASIKSHLSRTNEEGYAAEFGGDIKRIVADVVDYNRGDGWNTYTLIDDSVVDPSQLGGEIVAENARSPGLTAWVPDDFMDYGPDSQCEFYGTITVGDEGQVSMNVCGIVPLWPMELPEADDDTGGQADQPDSTTTSVI